MLDLEILEIVSSDRVQRSQMHHQLALILPQFYYLATYGCSSITCQSRVEYFFSLDIYSHSFIHSSGAAGWSLAVFRRAFQPTASAEA